MEKKNRDRKVNRKQGGFFTKLFVNTYGNPEAIEDQDWYLDSPDVRLTRVFSVVLGLHIVAVGGILAFKVIGKASSPVTLAQESSRPAESSPVETQFAGKAEPVKAPEVSVPSVVTDSRSDRYCVLPGDTLSGIAAKLGVTTEQMKTTNHINSPDEIIPGMWLKKPVPVVLNPTEASEPLLPVAATPDSNKSTAPAKSVQIYTVKPGDTAWRIAQNHGVSHQKLLEYNGVSRAELLQVGQLLKIPSN